MNPRRQHLLIYVSLLGCFVVSAGTLCVSHGAPPNEADATTKSDGLFRDPRYAKTLEYLEQPFRHYGEPVDQIHARTNQKDVECLLHLRSLRNSRNFEVPYIYDATVSVAGPNKFRTIVVKWLDTSRSTPKFNIIGRGGNIVGTTSDAPQQLTVYGGDEELRRSCIFVPLLTGENDARRFDDKEIPIHLDVKSLREIEGIEQISTDGSIPHFVPVVFLEGVFPALQPQIDVDPVK